LHAKHCETHSITRKRKRLKRKLHMATRSLCCTCATTGAELSPRLSISVLARGIGVCPACANAPRVLAGSWKFGVNTERGRRSHWLFLRPPPTVHPISVVGFGCCEGRQRPANGRQA